MNVRFQNMWYVFSQKKKKKSGIVTHRLKVGYVVEKKYQVGNDIVTHR